MKRIHKILVGTAGALTLAVVTAVAAAPDGLVGQHGGMGMGGGMGMMQGAMSGGQPGAMSAQHLAGLKTRLAITEQQQPAWQAFADRAGEQAALMQASHAQHHQPADTTTAAPDQMAQHIGAMAQHLTGMQAMNGALTNLYAVLNPQQRSVADQLFGHMGQRGMGGGSR